MSCVPCLSEYITDVIVTGQVSSIDYHHHLLSGLWNKTMSLPTIIGFSFMFYSTLSLGLSMVIWASSSGFLLFCPWLWWHPWCPVLLYLRISQKLSCHGETFDPLRQTMTLKPNLAFLAKYTDIYPSCILVHVSAVFTNNCPFLGCPTSLSSVVRDHLRTIK